jgi:hypothetical protein
MQVKLDCGKVMIDDSTTAWEYNWREAHPHEAVPALIEIVSDLQRRIIELERCRSRACE